MNRCASRYRRKSGFTLVELLIAVTLLSIVMSAVYTLFHGTVRVLQGVDRQSEGVNFDLYRESRNALTLFEHELDNVEARAAHLIEGQDDEVTLFVLAEPMQIEDFEGRHLMRVRYRHNRSRKTLIREEALVETALPKKPPQGRELDRERIKLRQRESFTVAHNIRDFKLTYVWIPLPRSRPHGTAPQWEEPIRVSKNKERWGLPQAIEIEMEIEDPNRRGKRDIIKTTIPVRAPNIRRTRAYLERELGSSTL